MNKMFSNPMIKITLLATIMMTLTGVCFATEKTEKQREKSLSLPKNVVSISKYNTFPNISEDYEIIEPSNLTEELLDSVSIAIENPELIKLLNETSIKPSPIGIGYRGMVYLGRWPLNYQSEDVTVNWDYQPINTNEINNVAGKEVLELRFIQQGDKEVKGALSNKIDNPEIVKKMMLQKSKENTKLPLSFTAVVGSNTKLDSYYNVPVKKSGQLHAYVPAVNEKGKVTFGEVYIQLKGSKKKIVIKNVTTQGIGAWIPIQDHISLLFQLK